MKVSDRRVCESHQMAKVLIKGCRKVEMLTKGIKKRVLLCSVFVLVSPLTGWRNVIVSSVCKCPEC